jgi:hypothetical protein
LDTAGKNRRKFAGSQIVVQTNDMDYAHGDHPVRVRKALTGRRAPQTGPVTTVESQLPVVILFAFAAVAAIQMLLQG